MQRFTRPLLAAAWFKIQTNQEAPRSEAKPSPARVSTPSDSDSDFSPGISPCSAMVYGQRLTDLSPRTSYSHLSSDCLPGTTFWDAYISMLKVLEVKPTFKRKTPAEMMTILHKLEDLKHDPLELVKLTAIPFSPSPANSPKCGSFNDKVKEHKYDHDLEVLNEGLNWLSQMRKNESQTQGKHNSSDLEHLELCCSELQSVIGEYIRFIERSSSPQTVISVSSSSPMARAR